MFELFWGLLWHKSDELVAHMLSALLDKHLQVEHYKKNISQEKDEFKISCALDRINNTKL